MLDAYLNFLIMTHLLTILPMEVLLYGLPLAMRIIGGYSVSFFGGGYQQHHGPASINISFLSAHPAIGILKTSYFFLQKVCFYSKYHVE